jgi:hypothetical protein
MADEFRDSAARYRRVAEKAGALAERNLLFQMARSFEVLAENEALLQRIREDAAGYTSDA